MSLRGCPLLYVFLESSELQVQRSFFEEGLGLELIEIEPHLPHHRHGVVKYDAGNLIVSLNEATNGVFRDGHARGGYRLLPYGRDCRSERLRLLQPGAVPGDVFRPRWRL